MLTSIAEYCPEVPVYLRGPESIISGFDADLKVFGAAHNFRKNFPDRKARGIRNTLCLNAQRSNG